MRRAKAAILDKHYLLEILKGKFKFKLDQIPDDAQITNVSYNPMFDGLVVVLEHPSFDEVPNNERLPILDSLVMIKKKEAIEEAIKTFDSPLDSKIKRIEVLGVAVVVNQDELKYKVNTMKLHLARIL